MNHQQLAEVVLPLFAVIAGSVAASGAFVSASYEHQRVALEEKPAIFLTCEPEIPALDMAQGTKPGPLAAFITHRGVTWVHIASTAHDEAPAPFARCVLSNYGRLPVVNLRLRLALFNTFGHLDIPGLAPSDRYEFSLVNGESTNLRFSFNRTVSLTRVDTGTEAMVPLFLSNSLMTLQGHAVEPAPVNGPKAMH